MIWVIDAKYISDYSIQVEFNNHKKGTVDLKELVKDGFLKSLKDKEKFKKFSLNNWTIQWENGFDISPEFLYKQINNHKK